ncbi:MAG TPA: selenocysteine-specific translation elongation factor [Actinomycetota bacterium]|nr:selenocysteine-specific translation elongation factor [Actinomycetota bacterium]
MHVIATAGHVDHGKSSLVQALTGIDPDRLEEEKRRGLTIDLGFASVRLPSGREVGIVDVPGHERFIKNMLAGVGAITVALFVVAANEGWKPQSQEHLDILDLLGVSSAVVAVTKADLVDDETLEIAVDEVREHIAGTALAGAAIVPVSSVTRSGLGELLAELERVIEAAPPAEDRGRPRLWIDRVFTMKGAGTVVTGTLIDGGLRPDYEVEVLPGGRRARIRGIQSHGQALGEIGPGNRAALNLVGIEPEALERGQVLTRPGLWRASRACLAVIRILPQLTHDVTERGAFKLYVGSAERAARVRWLSPPPEPGLSGLALITFAQTLVLDWHDHVVLRDSGRLETLGGGIVLEPHPRRLDGSSDAGSLNDRAERRLGVTDRSGYFRTVLDEEGVLAAAEVPVRTGLPEAAAQAAGGLWFASTVFSERAFARASEVMTAELRAHQRDHPLEAGMPRPLVKTAVGLDARPFDELVDELARRGVVVADAAVLRTPDFTPALGGRETEELVGVLRAAGAAPPTLTELGAQFDPALIRGLVRSGVLIAVSQELVYLSDTITEIRRLVSDRIATTGPFTVAQFRDAVGASRKYVVPLLEYLDRIGFTLRQGDLRVLGPTAGPPGRAEKPGRGESGGLGTGEPSGALR